MAKGSILLVSYHFYPSLEVGAKRPSETALFLQSNGYDVTVLRGVALEAVAKPSGPDLAALRILSVRIPKRTITALWIKLKGLVRGNVGPVRAAESGSRVAGDTTGGAPKLTPLGWLRRQVLAYDTLFQGNKRWLLKSVLKVAWQTRGRRFDLVIASGPPMVSYISGWALAALKKSKLILDYRDPWYLHGDEELTTVMLGHPLANFENGLARVCASRCAAITAASAGTKDHIVDRLGVDPDAVRIVRNGYDPHAIVSAEPPAGRLEMLFAGSLYWNRNPFPFLCALNEALGRGGVVRDRVHCRLVGNCEEWKGTALRPWIEERNLQDVVEILPFVSPDELRVFVEASNVLINFAQGQPRQIPAKSYDYIAARRDVLLITESDSNVARLFQEAGLGLIVEPDDDAGFADAIASFYARHVNGKAARADPIDVELYSRTAQLSRFMGIVEDVMDDRSTADGAHSRL